MAAPRGAGPRRELRPVGLVPVGFTGLSLSLCLLSLALPAYLQKVCSVPLPTLLIEITNSTCPSTPKGQRSSLVSTVTLSHGW